MEQRDTQLTHWTLALDEREQAQVDHALEYAARHTTAGVPGHGQFLLIAKLVKQLDLREHALINTIRTPVVQQVAWSGESKCWRDLITGVRVEINS